MEPLSTTSVDRVITQPEFNILSNLQENYMGVQAEEKKAESALRIDEKEKRITELVFTRVAASNLTEEYVERVEVRGDMIHNEQRYLGTDFYGQSEGPFMSSFRHPKGSELLIAAKRNNKVFFTRVKVEGDTAIDVNVQKGYIVAQVYSFDGKTDFRAKTSRVMQASLILNECSAKSIDDIHPLM